MEETVAGVTTSNVVDNAECCSASAAAGDELSLACATNSVTTIEYEYTVTNGCLEMVMDESNNLVSQ